MLPIRTEPFLTLCAALALVTAVHADEIPHRKPGLWEITTVGSTTRTQKVCLDRDTEALLDRAAVATSQETCSKTEMQMSGAHLHLKASCDMGGTRMVSEATTTFDGDSAYQTIVHATFNPPMMGKAASDSTQSARWIAACPADMKPGDMIVQTGGSHPHEQRMNLRTLLGSSP
jgi:hypothetical protein